MRLLFGNLVVNDAADVPLAAHAMGILRHDLVQVLARQVVAAHLPSSDGLLAVVSLGLVLGQAFSILLPHSVALSFACQRLRHLFVVCLIEGSDIATEIGGIVCVGASARFPEHSFLLGRVNVLHHHDIASTTVAEVKALDVLNIDIAEVVLALVQLLLDLPVLLVFLLLVDQVFVEELQRRDLVVEMQVAHQKTLFALLVLLVHLSYLFV